MVNFKSLKKKLYSEIEVRNDSNDQFIYSFVLEHLNDRNLAIKFMTSKDGGYTTSEAKEIRYRVEYKKNRYHRKLNIATDNKYHILIPIFFLSIVDLCELKRMGLPGHHENICT